MHFRWIVLFVSLVLLLPPLPFSASFERMLLKARSGGLAQTWGAARVWQNWVDFFRAAVGVFLLSEWAIVEDPSRSGDNFQSLAIQSAVLAAVLLPQVVRRMRHVQIVAPIFYLCGMTLILGWFSQGAFAVVVGWLFAIGGKNLGYVLPAMAFALGAAGYVLGFGLPLMLMVNCALIFLPFTLATLFKKRLLFVADPSSI